MRDCNATVVSGARMCVLSEDQQIRTLMGPYYVCPVDDEQRIFFDNLIREHFKKNRGRRCILQSGQTYCGDKHGRWCANEPPLEFHHVVAGQGLYYISSYRHANDPVKRAANIDAYMEEAQRCVLLCAKHHKEWHTKCRIEGRKAKVRKH